MNENQLNYIKALLLALHYQKELSNMYTYCQHMEMIGEKLENAINLKIKYKKRLNSKELFDSLIYIREKRGLYGIIQN